MRVRREKLDRLRAAGVDPYPVGYPRTATIAEVIAAHPGLDVDVATGDIVGIAGRVLLSRTGGKLCFATLRDGTGDLQVMLSLDQVGEERLAAWKTDVDLGDHVGITGEVITSKRGELSVLAHSWALTAKCLRPLPDKHKGLADPETLVRQRYVDLIVNPEARRMLTVRSDAVRSLRSTLADAGFLEVETPMLQAVHGGANARPFITHINAYDAQLYLRIAPELYLKRLAVGGVEKVFEINRNFRNEGVDASHNPEFTMLEAYEAYDIGGAWRAITVNEGLSEVLGTPITADTPLAELIRMCEKADVALDPKWNRGQVILEMYERLLEEHTVLPTFYRDFPTEVSPLTRAHRDDPRLAERWDLVAFGHEIGTAYSELIDPTEQ